VDISLPGRTIARAFLADARERDIERLVVRSGAARVPLESGIVTVRLLTGGKGKKS
jgi:hypothetical protein